MALEHFDTRNAPKFVMRSSTEMLEVLGELGRSNGRSTNSEIQVGLEAWLNGVEKTEYRMSLYESFLGKAKAAKIIAGVEKKTLEQVAGNAKFVIRLKAGMREAISGLSKRSKAQGNGLSQHMVILIALNWWVNTTNTFAALESACQQAALSEAA